MKKILFILFTISFLTACNINVTINETPEISPEEEFNNSGRAKAIEDETDLWQLYSDEGGLITMKYPHNIELGKDLLVAIDEIDTLEEELPMGYGKLAALENQEALTNGNYGSDVDWPLEASKKVRKIGEINAQDFMVLSRFEICDTTFERKTLFYYNGHQIEIILKGPADEIKESMPEYFSKNEENCGEMIIWNFDKQEDFYKTLKKGKGSEVTQEWFDLFDKIVNTIELNKA